MNCSLSFTVLLRLTGTLSERIIALFAVLVLISFDVLPALQFILLIFSFGSRTGQITLMINSIHSINSINKLYSCKLYKHD